MAAFLTVAVLTFLFAVVDVWYFISMLVLVLRLRFWQERDFKTNPMTEEEFTRESFCSGIVLLSDIDMNLHMNNSRYLREFDRGRIKWAFEAGIRQWLSKHNAFWTVSASSIRYRREMRLFQRFTMVAKFIWWEDDAIYMEQRMVTPNGFVTAIMLVKVAVRGVTVGKMQEGVCGHQLIPPPIPPEVKSWRESISFSSKKLRGATIQNH